MKRSFIIIVLKLFVQVSLYGQWVKSSPEGTPFSALHDATIVYNQQNEYTIFAAAGSEGVYRSTNKGLTWNQVFIGAEVVSIMAVPGNVQSPPILLIGTDGGMSGQGYICRSTNEGLTWNFVCYSWAPGGVKCCTYYTDPSGNLTIFAGANGVLRSTDNGINFTLVSNGFGLVQTIKVMPNAAGGTTIFAGTAGMGIYKSTDNCSSWIPSNTGLTTNEIKSFASSGNTLFAGTDGGIFKTIDLGLNWSPVSATTGYVTEMLESEGKLYAGTYNNGVFLSHDNGSNWENSSYGLPFYKIACLNVVPDSGGSNILTGFDLGFFYINTNDYTWIPYGLKIKRLFGLDSEESDIYAASQEGIYYSTDSGDSWNAMNTGLPSTLYCSFAIYPDGSGGKYLLVSAKNWGPGIGIFRSTNLGITWTKVVDGVNGYDLALSTDQIGNTVIFGATDNGVLISTDNGINWILKNNGISGGIYSLFARGTGAAQRIYAGGEGLYYSTDFGENWIVLSNPFGYIISLIVSGDTLFAGTWNGFSVSTDHGSTWSRANNGLTSGDIYSLVFIPQGVVPVDHLFAGTGTGVFLSTNNGSNWIPVNEGLPFGLEGNSLYLKDSTLFAGTTGGIWKRPLTQLIVQVEDNDPVALEYTLSQNYPNPFNPSTTINYSLPEMGKVRLIIYDALGREVRKLVDEEKDAGKYEIKFNADGLASGMYFYRLSANNCIISKKMSLLK